MTVYSDIIAHAEECAPRECCGAIIDGRIIRARNLSPSKDTYIMDPEVVMEVNRSGGPSVYYHSHVDSDAEPSEIDKVACNTFQIPMLIYSLHTQRFVTVMPEAPWRPILATKWKPGAGDCLGLVQEYFRLVHGLELPEHERPNPEDYGEWEEDPFGDYDRMGFSLMPEGEEIQTSDVLSFRIRSRVANHLGVVVGSGDEFLHRPIDAIAHTSDLSPGWRRRIVSHFRNRRLNP